MIIFMIGNAKITKSKSTFPSYYNKNININNLHNSDTHHDYNKITTSIATSNIITHISRCGADKNGIPTNTKITTTNTESLLSPPPPPALIKKINPHYAVLYGMILAFNSGILNGVTLSGILSTIKQPSSAVTGSWTNSALTIASGGANSKSSIINNLALKCILSYMSGSFIAGLFNPYPMNYSMKRHTIRPCFLIATLITIGSYFSLSKDKYQLNNASSTTWILLVLMANGIQNSITSSLSNNLIRSSHYSGITSDMGTFLGQAMRGNKVNGLKLKVFIVLACSFWSGGFWSLGLVKLLGSKVLLLCALIYLLFGIFSI